MNEMVIQELINRFVEVSFKVNKKAETLIKEQISDDMTNDQHYLLRYIYKVGRVTSSELADVFEVNKSAITAIIKRLVERKLIIRTRDKEDRRIVYLTLTNEGKHLFEKTEEKICSLVKSIISKFELKEIEDFITTYENLANILEDTKLDKPGGKQ